MLVGLRFPFRFRFGFGVGGADGGIPGAMIEVVSDVGLPTDVLLALEKKLSEIGEVLRAAGGDASGGDQLEELAHHMVDVGLGAEFTGDGGQLVSDFVGLKELKLFAGVEDAERGMGIGAEHAALAAVGERELAKFLLVGGDSGTRLLGGFHFRKLLKR